MIVDVQRTGPSTGMPTRTQQGDILACAYASHGDTKHILLFPANPEECFTFAVEAFDLAERFQTPVFMLSDLDIGMNDWVVPALQVGRQLPPRPRPGADRGGARGDAQVPPLLQRGRDHVAARTLPGVQSKGAFFTRGSGHNKFGGYTEIPDEYQEVMDRLARKHKAAAKAVPAPRSGRRPTPRSGSSRSAAATPRCARRWRRWPSGASSPTTCGSAASRSARRWRPSWPSTTGSSSSSRTATPSCETLLTLETASPRRSCGRCWSTAASRCRRTT